jgi:hypothetical protein
MHSCAQTRVLSLPVDYQAQKAKSPLAQAGFGTH